MAERGAVHRLRVLVVGVGGQGCITAARTLGEAAMDAGLDARVGELHGLAQRGGSVESQVVIGPGRTAMLDTGSADVVVGLEPLEVLRVRSRLSRRTTVLLNPARVVPFVLTHRGQSYPDLDRILDEIRAAAGEVFLVEAATLAARAGEPRAGNVVLLGALAGRGLLPFDADVLANAVERRSPARFRASNLAAFRLGVEAAQSSTEPAVAKETKARAKGVAKGAVRER